MAEELNLSEELTDNSLDLSSINTGSNYTTDLGEYSAKPASLDIYKNVVGNPLTGSNPKSKLENINTASLSPNEEAKLFDAKVQSSKSDYEKMRPYTYNGDVDGANFERYYSSNQYQKLGFSPFRDNEALYNSKMTFGDQFVRAASQWDNLALTGFKSGIRAWGTLFTDPLAPDIESAREMQKAMAIGNSNAGGIGGFVTNTFLNSAYTIGIAADFLAEEVALAGITAFTGGLAGEATLPGMAAKAGLATRKLFGFGEAAAKAGKNIAEASKLAQEAETVKKATDNIRGIRNFSDARTFYNSLKAGEIGAKQLAVGTLRTINPFENTLQALEKTDYATNLAKTVKTFGAFADDIVSIKTAVSEAKLEGGMVKIDANKALIDEYKRTHFGQEPDEKELAKIEALSGEESRRTAFWNLPAIMTSNKLLYNTMLAPIRKMVGRGSKVKMLDDIIAEKPLKANVAGGFTKLGEGLGSKARAAAKSLTKPKIYGQAGMSYLKANFAEGVQENIQEAISKGAINDALDVYKDPRMGAYKGYMAHFMEGMKDQFSAEGAETFAGGFLMGAFAQPIMAAPAWSFTKLSKLAGDKSKIEEAKKQRNETIDRQLKILNELSTDNLKYFAPDIIKAIKNGKLSDDLFTAIKEGKFKEAKDLQGEIEYNHIQTALETGKYDLFVDQLKDYKNLSTEEAAEAFAKYGISKEDVGKALKAMDGVIARAEKIKQTYEEVATNFPNPFNPTQYEHGSEAYLAAVDASIAWKKAQQNLVFASHTFDQYSERLEKMYNSFSNLSNSIAKQDAQYLMSVLTLPNLKQEISLLKDEIKTLGSVPEQASAKAQKEKRLELLEQFQQELLAADKETNPEEKEKLHGIAQKTFNKYAKFLSKNNNTIVFDKELDDAYSLLKDGLVIQNERQGLANSINVLSSPKGFLNLQYRLQKAITEHGTEKERLAKELYENFIKLQEKNDALNEIQKQTGLILSPDYISEYQDALDKGEDPLLPSSFINPATNEKVTSGEKFNKALDLWEIHLAIIKETAKLKKEDVPEQTIIKKFDVNNYDEYPDELKAEIQKLYDEQIKNGDISDDLNIEEFALQNLAAKKLVKAYKDKLDKEEQASKTSAFQEYLSLSLDELKTKYNTVLQEFKTNPDLLEEKNKLQQALNYKIRQSIKMTPEQERALGLIKALSNKTVNKDKEDNKYIVNGEKKDTRVTKLVDQILEENYPDYSKFALFEKSAKPILEAYQKAKEDVNVKATASDRVKYIDAIFDYINKELADNTNDLEKKKAEKLFKEQFNDRKLKLFKEELKSNTSEANFKKLFEKYIYEETTIRGNIVDAIIRDYFEGKELIKPSSMSDKAFNKLRESLIQFEQKLIELNEIPVSTGLVLTGETTNTVNGKPETIAGEMDLLVVTPNGEYKIYDMKTSTSWKYFGNPTDKSAKKDRYSLQLSLYKNLLENLTGIKVTNLELIAFKTEEDLNGNIKSLEEETTASKTKIDYNKYKDNVSKYIPSKLEVAAPVPTETTTTTDIEAKRANIEKTRQEEISKIVSKYFPNSKFTDILYHGTRGQERFEKFDENRMGELDSGYFGKGFYLTPERAYAEGYAKPYNGIVLYTVVNLENPLVTDANQANTGITLENYDGAIVKLGEDTLGISEEKYDPNQVIEVVLKKADQIQILSEEESRKVDEINAEYNAKLDALEGVSLEETTPTEIQTKLEETSYEQIGDYFISMPIQDIDNVETIIVENRKGKGMLYTINTDKNGSVISLTPRNKPNQRITNEKLLVAVEIKRNKYNFELPVIEEISKNDEVYNEIKSLVPATQILENILNLGLDNELASLLNDLYSNKELNEVSLYRIQLWANNAAEKIDYFLQNRFKNNEEFTKAWDNLYIINELVLEKLKLLEKQVKEKPEIFKNEAAAKSVEQLLKERDEELKFIQEKRKELGIEFDPLDDVPMLVVITMDRFDNNLPIDPVSLMETSDWLYSKYKELTNMQLDPQRLLTLEQIDGYLKTLEKDITALEEYKNKLYNTEKNEIIQDENVGVTDTTGTTTDTRKDTIVKKTSFDEPITRKARKIKKEKVNKVKEDSKKNNTIVIDKEPADLQTSDKSISNNKEFNELSIEKKFKTIVDELKPGEQISGVFQKGVYPNAADESSYHVVLDDGRVVRVTQLYDLKKIPIGEKVTLQKIKKSFLKTAIGNTFEAILGGKPSIDVIEVSYNGNYLAYVRTTTPKNEKAKVEVPVNKQATLETLNQNININSLEVAKDRNYEVIYESVENPDKNGRYMIEKVTENSVYLSNVSGKVEVKKENIPGQIKNIIDIKGPENNNDDINTAINNNEAVKKTKFNYSEQNDDKLNDDITNNIC